MYVMYTCPHLVGRGHQALARYMCMSCIHAPIWWAEVIRLLPGICVCHVYMPPFGGQRSSGFGPVEVKWFVVIGRRRQEVRSLPAWLEVWPIEAAEGT